MKSTQALKLIPVQTRTTHNCVNENALSLLALPVFIQILFTFFLSKCSRSNTATSVSCEATTMLNVSVLTQWKIIIVYASSCEASKWLVSLSGFEDSMWVTSLKPPATTIVLSTGACSINCWNKYIARSAFLSGWDKKFYHLVGKGMSWLSVTLLSGWERTVNSSLSDLILNGGVILYVKHDVDAP